MISKQFLKIGSSGIADGASVTCRVGFEERMEPKSWQWFNQMNMTLIFLQQLSEICSGQKTVSVAVIRNPLATRFQIFQVL